MANLGVERAGFIEPEGESEGLATTGSALPQLSHDQAMFISLLMESGDALRAEREFKELFSYSPDFRHWGDDADYAQALTLTTTNRPLLLRALSHSLSGKVFRALSRMLDSPRSAPKAAELFLRLHGMLIDRVRDSRPDEYRELISLIRERTTPSPTDFHVAPRRKEGGA